jgi:hypothetical protein
MAGFLENMSTSQKIMLAGGAGLVGLLFMGGLGKKKGGGDAGALGIVDVRRPTDDINAPAGIPRYPDIIVNVPDGKDGGGGKDPAGGDGNALRKWQRQRRARRKQLARRGGGFSASDEKKLAHWKEQHPKPGTPPVDPPPAPGTRRRRGRGRVVASPPVADSLDVERTRATFSPAGRARRR